MPKKETRGARFAREVHEQYEGLRPDEELLLAEIASTIDQLDALPASEVAERRQQRLVLSRLLGQLNLPEQKDQPSISGPSVRGRRAAEARWRRESA